MDAQTAFPSLFSYGRRKGMKDSTWAVLIALTVLVVTLLWLSVFVYDPTPTSTPTAAAHQEAKEDAIAKVYRYFLLADFGSPRLEPNSNPMGNTLDVYVKKSEFESIPFPDRNKFIEAAGKLWCEQPNPDGFLPSLSIYDIR